MSNHRVSRIASFATLSFAIYLSGFPALSAANERNWSVDLHDYMMREANSTARRSYQPTLRLAATNNVIAVAIGIPDSPATEDNWDRLYSGPWKVTLLLFDGNSGKLTKKSGPWSGGSSIQLHPTGQGNFLLFIRQLYKESPNPGETLRLLSSSGEELKKMDLPESTTASRRGWSEFIVSPGGHMVLIGQIREGHVNYRALEADTLETKFEWAREAGSDSPVIVAISDKELLGFRDIPGQEKRRGWHSEKEAFARAFDGPWHPLNTTLDVSSSGLTAQGLNPTQVAFLSDNILVGVHRKSSECDSSLVELQSDGTTPSRPVIPELPDRTTLTGPVAVTGDGQYFAVGFQHQPWISHLLVDVLTMDLTFWPDELLFLIWESSRPEPVARISLGTEVRAICFAPDDPPTLAFIAGSRLQVLRIHPKTDNSHGQ
jgi:hypothetical protein